MLLTVQARFEEALAGGFERDVVPLIRQIEEKCSPVDVVVAEREIEDDVDDVKLEELDPLRLLHMSELLPHLSVFSKPPMY